MGNAFATKLASVAADLVKPYLQVADVGVMFKNLCQVQFGSVTGTGASLDVTTEGNPRAVIAVNTNNGCAGIKITGMATKYAAKFKASDNSQAYADEMVTLDTNKFTFGTDSDMNTAHTIVWMAII